MKLDETGLNVRRMLSVMSQNHFASADFNDSDAGAGGLVLETTLIEFIKVDEAIKNLLAVTSNVIETNTDVYLNDLQEFKTNLRKLCGAENLKLLEFMLKPETNNIKNIIELGTLLSCPNFNPFSKDILSGLSIDISGSDTNFKNEIGSSLENLDELLMNLNKFYLQSMNDLFLADKNLNEAYANINHNFKRIDMIMGLDINESTLEMYASLAKYIHSSMSKFKLKEFVTEFIEARKKFIYYRSLIKSRQVTAADNTPLCSICLLKEISHVLIGCGHTYCDDCSKKQLSFCYICRCKIDSRMKIYLS